MGTPGPADSPGLVSAPDVPVESSEGLTCANTAKGVFKWTIKHLSFVASGVGQLVLSPTFRIGGYEWYLKLYPDGKEDYPGHLAIKLFVKSGTCKATRSISIVNQCGKPNYTMMGSKDPQEYTPTTGRGYDKFIPLTMFKDASQGNLVNDTAIFECQIEVLVNKSEETVHSPSPSNAVTPPDQTWVQHMQSLLDNGQEHSDVCLEVKASPEACAHPFQCHKAILAARSPVFNAMFKHGCFSEGNSDTAVAITDVTPDEFEVVLRYIYTGTVDPDILQEHAATLMTQADKYDLEGLRTMCGNRLQQSLSVNTVCTTLAIADMHNATELQTACLDFICRHPMAVIQSGNYKQMVQEAPHMVAKIFEHGIQLGVGIQQTPPKVGFQGSGEKPAKRMRPN